MFEESKRRRILGTRRDRQPNHRGLKWTRHDIARAQSQGWDVFDYDVNGLLEICKLDESDRFKTDDEALRFVIAQASRGCITAKRALAHHVRDAWKLKQEFHRRMA